MFGKLALAALLSAIWVGVSWAGADLLTHWMGNDQPPVEWKLVFLIPLFLVGVFGLVRLK